MRTVGCSRFFEEKEFLRSCGFLTLLKIQISRDDHRGTKNVCVWGDGTRNQVQIKIDLKYINLKK